MSKANQPKVNTYGRYALYRAGNALRDEWTNVGVMLYASDGNLIGVRTDIRRAIARGELKGCADDYGYISPEAIAALYPTVESVERSMQSVGQAMSFLQVHWGGSSRSDQLEALFRLLVLALDAAKEEDVSVGRIWDIKQGWREVGMSAEGVVWSENQQDAALTSPMREAMEEIIPALRSNKDGTGND